MTKKFDVIPVEDYAVVVDKEAGFYIGAYVINNLDKQHGNCSRIPSLEERRDGEYSVVIATIGKRIEGLPLIELPVFNIQAKALDYLIQSNKEIEEAGAKHLVSNNDYDQGFIDGASFGYKAAQSKGVYNEEDMWGVLHMLLKLPAGQDQEDAMYDYLKSLQKNKLPVAVELEMEAYNPPEEQHLGVHKHLRVVITDTENNTIKPVEVYYKMEKNKIPLPEESVQKYGWTHSAMQDYARKVVQYTLGQAAEKAEAIEGYNTGFSGNAASVDQQSILSLEEEIIKQLNL